MIIGDIARSATLTVTILVLLFIAAVLLLGCAPMTHRMTLPPDDPPPKCEKCR